MNELRAHTGLRGLASLAVVFSHFCVLFPIANLVQFIGGPAVDLFFILSGFILCYVYHRDDQPRPHGGWWGYHVARFARIYPIYFVVTAVMIGHRAYALRYVPYDQWPWWEMFVQLTLIFHWPFFFTNSWNTPTWSISVEYFCYLFLFPLTFAMRHLFRHAWVAIAAVVVLQVGLVDYLGLFNYFFNVTIMGTFEGWTGLIRGLVGFTSGVAIFHLYRYAPGVTRVVQKLSFPLVLACAGVITWAGFTYPQKTWWLLLIWPWLVLAFTDAQTFFGRIFAGKVFHFFGDISYGMYVIHMPVFLLLGPTVIFEWLGEANYWVKVAGACGLAALAILISWLSYRFFEMPVRIWIRRLLGAKTRKHAGESPLPSINSPTV